MARSVRFEGRQCGRWRRSALAAGLLLLNLMLVAHEPQSLRAAEAAKSVGGMIGLELNRMETVGEGGRLSFIFRNGLQETIQSMTRTGWPA